MHHVGILYDHFIMYLNGPPIFRILGQTNTYHALRSYLCKIQFRIICPSTSRSPKLSLSVMFMATKFYIFLINFLRSICPLEFKSFQQNLVKVSIMKFSECMFSIILSLADQNILQHSFPAEARVFGRYRGCTQNLCRGHQKLFPQR